MELEILVLAVDQHAAHERILLEHFLKAWKHENIFDATVPHFGFSIRQNVAVKLHLSVSDRIMKRLFRDLKHFGIEVEMTNPSENMVQVTSFPVDICHSWTLPGAFISLLSDFFSSRVKFLLGEVSNHGEGLMYLDAAVILLLQTKACKSAIQFGDQMEVKEQYELLDQLFNCSQPFHCAHGRPSMATLLKTSTGF
ncbi:DNA mismatch repair protein Mlh3 [Echinococcus granulosus]|nr:DNA mismatch repair protein Mlh3 [Echinococcus granulosus]